jgi:hypothetical protein
MKFLHFGKCPLRGGRECELGPRALTDFQNSWVNMLAHVNVQRGDEETQIEHGRRNEMIPEERNPTNFCCSQATGCYSVLMMSFPFWLPADLWPAQRARLTEY